MTADEYFRSKESVPSEMRTAEWDMQAQWAREKAFYSAGVAEAEILDELRVNITQVVEGSTDESTARKNIQMYLDKIGYKPMPGQEGTIKDLRSIRRLQVMIRTNRALANGYAQKVRGMGKGAATLYPAWELIRILDRVAPREWEKRWEQMGSELAENGRMIALKTDLIWAEIGNKKNFSDALGVDYPPFAWGSGMSWQEVRHAEAKKMGLLDGWKPPTTSPPLNSPNESLQVTPKVASPSLRKALAERLQGLAEWKDNVLVFTDPNGTRKMSQKEAALVITAKLPDDMPNLQASAAKLWFMDASKNIKLKRGKNVLDDFTRLVRRIIPLKNGIPVYRGEYFASEMDLKNRLQELRAGHAVTNMGNSFSVIESVAVSFARGKTPYELILVCKNHATLRPVFEIAKKVYPKYWKQGEVIALEGVQLRSVGEPVTMIDTKGRKQIYLEVEEVVP